MSGPHPPESFAPPGNVIAFHQGKRDAVAAGKAHRAMVDRARQAKITNAEWRVVAAVAATTASYGRVSDSVWAARLAELVGISTARVLVHLRRLHALGVITWRGSRVKGRPSWLSMSANDRPTT